MSTSRTPDRETWVSPRVDADDAYLASVREACEETASRLPALCYLAYLRNGVPLVRLGRGEAGDVSGGTGMASAFTVLARQMAYHVRTLDEDLQKARTGRLIRTVLHTDAHALFYDMVRPGEEFLGVVEQPDAVRAGDEAVAELAAAFRARARLTSANYGSFACAHPGPPPAVPADGTVQDRLRAVVRPDGLHFASYWVNGRREEIEHCFSHPGLTAPVVVDADAEISPRQRLDFHLAFARRLKSLATDLKLTSGGALKGRLNRIVLDVEAGAVFYARLPAQRYLTAVTLDQSMVSLADDIVVRLAQTLWEPNGDNG
ncbi:hypothetical protein [Actinokineospora fastidiosa]|uniref:Uncharacterized protein n=1 Tax=Actinokineospora fastidiosa TaxID=1816 RepID=A0A918LIC2_9PSEU|nr:hypothetical protein [Actinokineospora fastidiosa]GGS52109.1 hypothetical protein GCM10010171_53970 [Actinokineospora fastidiosa]